MQGYNASFARIYNMRWAGFANQVAPRILGFYETLPASQNSSNILDLCCGTGQLALYFLDHGYQVTGLDLSEAMLEFARANTSPYIVTGQARFVRGDAANFTLDEQFGLAVSTFDALNHLPDLAALSGCFQSVYPLLIENGLFIFDLNTRLALSRWTSVSVEDTPDLALLTRAIWDEGVGRATTLISGFIPAGNGLYERFEETAYETAFDLQEVQEALLSTGFRSVRFTRAQDFLVPIEEPERESRIFIVAQK